ncbi:hypothetical protein HG530_011833 [Fusarium avenaceum]|nr:hypothetical protein HG530_011833 [Fusarium avenaceum]
MGGRLRALSCGGSLRRRGRVGLGRVGRGGFSIRRSLSSSGTILQWRQRDRRLGLSVCGTRKTSSLSHAASPRSGLSCLCSRRSSLSRCRLLSGLGLLRFGLFLSLGLLLLSLGLILIFLLLTLLLKVFAAGRKSRHDRSDTVDDTTGDLATNILKTSPSLAVAARTGGATEILDSILDTIDQVVDIVQCVCLETIRVVLPGHDNGDDIVDLGLVLGGSSLGLRNCSSGFLRRGGDGGRRGITWLVRGGGSVIFVLGGSLSSGYPNTAGWSLGVGRRDLSGGCGVNDRHSSIACSGSLGTRDWDIRGCIDRCNHITGGSCLGTNNRDIGGGVDHGYWDVASGSLGSSRGSIGVGSCTDDRLVGRYLSTGRWGDIRVSGCVRAGSVDNVVGLGSWRRDPVRGSGGSILDGSIGTAQHINSAWCFSANRRNLSAGGITNNLASSGGRLDHWSGIASGCVNDNSVMVCCGVNDNS